MSRASAKKRLNDLRKIHAAIGLGDSNIETGSGESQSPEAK